MAEVESISVEFVSVVEDVCVNFIDAVEPVIPAPIYHGIGGLPRYEWPIVYDYVATGGIEYKKTTCAEVEFLPDLKMEKTLRLRREDEEFLMMMMELL